MHSSNTPYLQTIASMMEIPFMDEVISERQLIKWGGIFQVGISWVRIFRGEFSEGEFDWWEFSGGDFTGENFPITNLDIKPRGIRDYDE